MLFYNMRDEKSTFCNKLWDEIYINQYGDIYSCCHEGPEKLGNIYNETLESIMNGETIQKHRKQALCNNLKCLEYCNIRPIHRPLIGDETEIISVSKLHTLKILFGEKCNINCIMCWQDRKNTKMLDFEYLKKNIDIRLFTKIIVQGGEPLCSREVLDFFDYAIEKQVRLSFLTNGLLINDELARKIVVNSDFIHISVNAATKETHELINRGSKWEKLLSNIQLLKEYKKTYGTNIAIKGHMTIIKENIHEIPQFIQKFYEFGLDECRFGYDSCIPAYLNEHLGEKEALKNQITEAIENCKVGIVDTTRLEMLGLYDNL